MARLDRIGGFAQGFQSGFGLVNDIKDRHAKQEIAEEEIGLRKENLRLDGIDRQNTATYRAGQLASQDASKQRDDEHRLTQLGLQHAEKLAAIEERKKVAATAAEVNDLRFGSNNGVPNDPIRAAQLASANYELAQIERTNKQVLAGNAADQLSKFDAGSWLDADGQFSPEGAASYQKLAAQVKGTTVDLYRTANPINADVINSTAKEIKNMATGQVVNMEKFLGGMNSMALPAHRAGVGQLIPDDGVGFPHAPERIHGWKVINKEIVDGRMFPDGSIGGDMLVTVEDPKSGYQSEYIAPATEGGKGDSQAIYFTMDDMGTAFAAHVHFDQSMKKNASANLQALRQSVPAFMTNGYFDKGKYNAAYKVAEADFNEQLDERGTVKVQQGSNYTYNEINANPKLKKEFIEYEMLQSDARPISHRDGAMARVATTRSSPIVSKLEKIMKRKDENSTGLTNAQVLELRMYMDENGKIDDVKRYNQFYKKLTGINASMADYGKQGNTFGQVD